MELSRPVALDDSHDFSGFDSGEPSLDAWLRNRARANHAGGASRVFVQCEGSAAVRAFYALAAGAIELASAPGKLRRNMPDPIPMALLGRLAVHRAWHGRGIGRTLVRDAAERVIEARRFIGIRGLAVQAMSDEARRFYLACGFQPSPLDPTQLMTPLTATIPAPPANPAPPPPPGPSSGPS